jgi:Uma2 family endonuclease
MIQTHTKKITLEEYLQYECDTDNCYELIDGELIELPPESEPNCFIARCLLFAFIDRGLVPLRLISTRECEIIVPILREGDAANRYPDLVILIPEHIPLTATRFAITPEMPPPRLTVEIVSPGRVGRERDYDRKRAQYAARGIREYWIVDPQEQSITVLRLESDIYIEVGVFQGEEVLASPTFPQFNLTAQQVLDGDF